MRVIECGFRWQRKKGGEDGRRVLEPVTVRLLRRIKKDPKKEKEQRVEVYLERDRRSQKN